MTEIIRFRNCTAYRGNTLVFEGLSLSIDPGQHTVILGPNGAGKSTFLKLITQELRPVVQPDSSISLFGQRRWRIWELRDRLGIVSDDLQKEYLPGATGEHVVLSGFYSSIDIAPHHTFSTAQFDTASAIMEELGILHLKKKKYGTMSTGEKRRFLLARALIHDPEVLILDEPTTGLDLTAIRSYYHHMSNLMKAGRTIILVTHHIYEIPPDIRRVIMLKQGKIVHDGPKEKLLTSDILSGLYETPVRLVHAGGYYQVLPDFT